MKGQWPKGLHIRPLQGEQEVEACVACHQTTFESRNMTFSWRARTLRHPDYNPDLDLVAIAPDGRLAAFCICWLKSLDDYIARQIEPLGVHPDFRRLGLGRAMLCEALKRLASHGADQAFVETDNSRDSALGLYESVGFHAHRDILVYRKDDCGG